MNHITSTVTVTRKPLLNGTAYQIFERAGVDGQEFALPGLEDHCEALAESFLDRWLKL